MSQQDLFPETLLVHNKNGRLMTTSLLVAEHFGKRHKNVIQSIEKLIAECPDEAFGRLNFQPSSYLNEQNKQQPMYEITRNGFAILAMGFTGSQALRWKIDFLAAFDDMANVLQATLQREATVLYRLKPHWQTIQQGKRQGFKPVGWAGFFAHLLWSNPVGRTALPTLHDYTTKTDAANRFVG